MARELLICPHCRVQRSMFSEAASSSEYAVGHFLFVCPNCSLPIVIMAQAERPKPEYRSNQQVRCSEDSIAKCGWRIIESWPKPEFRRGAVPDGVPDAIRALFEHSQEAAFKGAYDLSIIGFQRVLRMVQQEASPGFKGNPLTWIVSLIEAGRITADFKRWATRLKLQREVLDSTALQAEEFAAFVHMLIEQLFAISLKMASYRAGWGPECLIGEATLSSP